MSFPYFTGVRQQPEPEGYTWIPSSRFFEETLPENYVTEKGLVDAVNVALLISKPLLLTGDPGTGKTQLAYRVAWELGLPEPLKFETKSNSESKDLFYFYNSLARFHAAQTGGTSEEGVEYITYNALGIAIIRSVGSDKFKHKKYIPEDFGFGSCRRSVVLIDEIDKAPRDFPNDVLGEIEEMYFRIPEFGNIRIDADPDMHPLIFITSNSEKNLPDAFLRRCVFYHIRFPLRERMRQIVEKRLVDLQKGSDRFISNAIDLFYTLRDQEPRLKKLPATAELLFWLTALRKMSDHLNPFDEAPEKVLNTLGVLLKSGEDLDISKDIATKWLQERKT